ncbi:hypothetical protein D3C78_1491050 [compost metagenome]
MMMPQPEHSAARGCSCPHFGQVIRLLSACSACAAGRVSGLGWSSVSTRLRLALKSASLRALAPALCRACRYLSASASDRSRLSTTGRPLNSASILPGSLLNSRARFCLASSRGVCGISAPSNTILKRVASIGPSLSLER